MTLLSAHLLSLLVCPRCLGPVLPGPSADEHRWLICSACERYYPVVDDIPVMIANRSSVAPPK